MASWLSIIELLRFYIVPRKNNAKSKDHINVQKLGITAVILDGRNEPINRKASSSN